MRSPQLIAAGSVSINMTPMIDVVFLLIIFFLVSSHLAKQENSVKLELPEANSGLPDQVDREILVVNVLESGQWQIAGSNVSLNRLHEILRKRTNLAAGQIQSAHSNRSQSRLRENRAHSGGGGSGKDYGRRLRRVRASRSELKRMKTDFSLTPTSRAGRPRRPIEIMMAPMIDVIFLLLIFFLATSSFQIPEKLLPGGISEIGTPTGQANQPPPEASEIQIEQIIIKAAIEGGVTSWTLNNVRLPGIAQLRDRLLALSQLQRDIPVIIDPNGKVPIGEVVTAYDAVREVGLTRVYMATHAKTGNLR